MDQESDSLHNELQHCRTQQLSSPTCWIGQSCYAVDLNLHMRPLGTDGTRARARHLILPPKSWLRTVRLISRRVTTGQKHKIFRALTFFKIQIKNHMTIIKNTFDIPK